VTERRDRPCVLIVQNSPGSGAGRFPDWLTDDGVEPVLVPATELPAHLDDAIDGMILLGGGFMPDDDERKPFLPTERNLVREAVETGLPLLGICLGAQVLAVAAGGEVTAQSGETERGSYAIAMLPAAADDPLFSELAAKGDELRMIERHEDSITALPPGAVHLATSKDCHVQAFRLGDAAWGVQFHPEAAASRVAEWDEEKLRAQGHDKAELVAQAAADDAVNTEQARVLAGAFARVVREARR
jgi:GMP synthase-like glutamine amidotransferase